MQFTPSDREVLHRLLAWRRDIEAGTLVGPHLLIAGPYLEAVSNAARQHATPASEMIEPTERTRVGVASPAEADRCVGRHLDERRESSIVRLETLLQALEVVELLAFGRDGRALFLDGLFDEARERATQRREFDRELQDARAPRDHALAADTLERASVQRLGEHVELALHGHRGLGEDLGIGIEGGTPDLTAVRGRTNRGVDAIYARMLRANLVDALCQDYIRTARAKGLAERTVALKHGMRNAITPLVTLVGIDLGVLLGGVILTETVFNIPASGACRMRRSSARTSR